MISKTCSVNAHAPSEASQQSDDSEWSSEDSENFERRFHNAHFLSFSISLAFKHFGGCLDLISAVSNGKMSAPPPGILPIYLRSAMVEQYGLVDYNGKPVVYKKISKTLILDDIQRQGVYNDFSEIKAKLQVFTFFSLI